MDITRQHFNFHFSLFVLFSSVSSISEWDVSWKLASGSRCESLFLQNLWLGCRGTLILGSGLCLNDYSVFRLFASLEGSWDTASSMGDRPLYLFTHLLAWVIGVFVYFIFSKLSILISKQYSNDKKPNSSSHNVHKTSHVMNVFHWASQLSILVVCKLYWISQIYGTWNTPRIWDDWTSWRLPKITITLSGSDVSSNNVNR